MESGTVVIRGQSIHYELIRPETSVRHHAFLLSAPGSSTIVWRNIVPELTQAGCLCVLCDMPGFGRSGFSENMPPEQSVRAQYMWGVLDEIDLDADGKLNCWHLMAQGSACGTIAEMALQQPDSVSSLFMASPILYSPVPAALRPLLKLSFSNHIIAFLMKRLFASEPRFARLMRWVYGRRLSSSHIKALRAPLERWLGHEDFARRFLLNGYSVNTGALSSLFPPAMIIWGGRDRFSGGDIPARLRKKDFPSAEYHLLKNAGHYAVETNSRAVCDFLRGWINGQGLGKGN